MILSLAAAGILVAVLALVALNMRIGPALEPSSSVTPPAASVGLTSPMPGATENVANATQTAPSPSLLTLNADERRGQSVSGPRFEACSNFFTAVEEGEPTIETAVLWSELTIVGDIKEIGGGRYNTPGEELKGERPVGMFDVYRPVIVQVDTVVGGGSIDRYIKVRLLGGPIVCDAYRNDRTQAVDGLGRYVLFLDWITDVRGNAVPEMTVVRAWLVTDSGMVVTPHDGTISIEEFRARIEGP